MAELHKHTLARFAHINREDGLSVAQECGNPENSRLSLFATVAEAAHPAPYYSSTAAR
jgi:hypothetical protein